MNEELKAGRARRGSDRRNVAQATRFLDADVPRKRIGRLCGTWRIDPVAARCSIIGRRPTLNGGRTVAKKKAAKKAAKKGAKKKKKK
jgi:hypothetical protein